MHTDGDWFCLSINQLLLGLILIIFFIIPNQANSQQYFGWTQGSSMEFFPDSQACGCTMNILCDQAFSGNGYTFSPEGELYIGTPDISELNPQTCFYTNYFTSPSSIELDGLVTIDGNLFYSMQRELFGDSLFEIDVSAGTITNLGSTGFPIGYGDMCLYNGEVYYYSNDGIVKLNISNPSSSELILSFPTFGYYSLTVSPWCNTLMATRTFPGYTQVQLINLFDGTLSILCQVPEATDDLVSMV